MAKPGESLQRGDSGPLAGLERGNYINGTFRPIPDAAHLQLRSPADTNLVLGKVPNTAAAVDEAVETGRTTQRGILSRMSKQERAEMLRRYQVAVKARSEKIAETIAFEVGKPLWDARTEANALASKVDLSLGEGAAYTADKRFDDLPGGIVYRPHGVVAVIGPFNFPAHLANGHIVPALLEGNAVVFKPSERAPGVATHIADALRDAGFPDGAFNVVHGDGHVAQALIAHPHVNAVLFTGSAAVGRSILRSTAETPGKLIALELGGKNASIVMDDAELERTARELAFSAFVTAGQRCTATSRVFAHNKIIDALVERLASIAANTTVGFPFDEGVFLGPMISAASRDALRTAQTRAHSAGITRITPSSEIEIAGHPGHYARPSVHRAAKSTTSVPGYTDIELFGPDVCVYPVDSLEEAVARANDSPYGLASAVFTAKRETFERAAFDLDVGVVHWNRSSAGASGRLPFGGTKNSGNHRAAGITAGLSCAFPVAHFELPPNAPLPTWPGMKL